MPRTLRRSVLLSRHWCPDHVHLPPTRCYICTNTKQATNNDISIYTSKHMHQYITQHRYKSQHTKTSHTSVIKHLPRRQYHIRVPPEVHPRVRKPKYELRRLSPYLRGLLEKVVTPFATTVANQNLRPPPQPWVSYLGHLQYHPRPQRWHPLKKKCHQDRAKGKLSPTRRPTSVQL